MTDELKRLREALGATRPELESAPDPEARRQAMEAALQAFDQENAKAAQGSAAGRRQNWGRASLLARLFGGRLMNIQMPSLKPALMGSASFAVIAIAVLATRDLPNKDAVVPLPTELRSEVDKASAVKSNELALIAPRRELEDADNKPALHAGAGTVATGEAKTMVPVTSTR